MLAPWPGEAVALVDVSSGLNSGLSTDSVTHVNEILVISQPNFVMRSYGRTCLRRDVARASIKAASCDKETVGQHEAQQLDYKGSNRRGVS